MWYVMEQIAEQREREIATRTRASLFGEPPRPARGRAALRSERGVLRLPRLSLHRLQPWGGASREIRCTRAAAWAGQC